MSSGKGRTDMFGRDEFNALLGGQDGLSEVLTRRTGMEGTASRGTTWKKGTTTTNQKDISDMTVEETAALLKQKQQQKVQSHHTAVAGSHQPRLRAASHRVREYHKLLFEEQQLQNRNRDHNSLRQQQQQPEKQVSSTATTQNTSFDRTTDPIHTTTTEDEDFNFDDRRNDTTTTTSIELPIRRRKKVAPVIIVELGSADVDPTLRKPLRSDTRSDDDDDSSKDGPPQRQNPQNHMNHSDDDDDDHSSVDRRRQRALQKRKQLALVDPPTEVEEVKDHQVELKNSTGDTNRIILSKDLRTEPHDVAIKSNLDQQPTSLHHSENDDTKQTSAIDLSLGTSNLASQQRQPPMQNDRSSSDSKDSGSSSSSSDSSDDSESDDGIIKPIFIPKHRRTMIQSMEDEQAQQIEKEQQEKEFKERRKQESRALLQESLMNAKLDRSNTNNDNLIDGITGAINEIPTDNDDNDDGPNLRYEDWEVRELERILEEWDIEVEKERNEEERNQRRRRYAPTGKYDDDYYDETDDVSRNKPKTMASDTSTRHQTGYHHLGAFFMEDTEDNDIRQKAMEYTNGAVNSSSSAGTMVHDRSQLPKVMQVKKFGFANQSKYRGLAAEDTTDKHLDILPIVHNKNKSKR